MYFIGADIGTSSVKVILTDETGRIHSSVLKTYPIELFNNGWSQQNPEDWWNGFVEAVSELLGSVDPGTVKGIACGGQMHGLVILDENDNVIRPCILWNDSRTVKETNYLNDVIGKKRLSDYTANIAFAGFTAPKLLWLKENEPENFARIRKIMLPKDYINYRLTGVHATDYSDASGMLLLDVKNKCWSKEMCEICSVDPDTLPALYESYEEIGTVNCEELPGLHGAVVAAGAGDNAAAAIGTNTIKDGTCNISLGTSGTIFIASDAFPLDADNALHCFAHAGGNYHLMGCMLSAASSQKWFVKDILQQINYEDIQHEIPDDLPGNNRIYFLPYLMGERSPLNDPDARACFIGMDMASTAAEMDLAVMEGVAFAIRDSLEIARGQGIELTASTLCGGGARSALWRKILANVLNIRIDIPAVEEGPAFGGALLAMTAYGRFATISECAAHYCRILESIEPDPALAQKYEQKYRVFHQIYPALKEIFKQL